MKGTVNSNKKPSLNHRNGFSNLFLKYHFLHHIHDQQAASVENQASDHESTEKQTDM